MGGFELLWSSVREASDGLTSPAAQALAAWTLAFVLAGSGATKLRRPSLAAIAIVDFGITSRLRTSYGLALGAVEVAMGGLLAASLLAGSAALATASALAALLFWSFVVLVGRTLRRGARFPCRCFGDESPLSAWSLVRAVALALVATGLAVAAALGAWDAPFHLLAVTATGGAAIVVGATLLGTIPRLLRWNADPFDAAQRRYQRRVAT